MNLVYGDGPKFLYLGCRFLVIVGMEAEGRLPDAECSDKDNNVIEDKIRDVSMRMDVLISFCLRSISLVRMVQNNGGNREAWVC